MSDTKHTLGPWHAYDRGIGWEVHCGAICGEKCFPINSEFRDTFTESDARPIAAAPDLLESLKELVTLTARKHDIWDKARAAIAKAEGR